MGNDKKIKAVAQISGGLDSTLAALIIKRLGIEVYGLHYTHAFNAKIGGEKYSRELKTAISQLAIPVEVIEITPEMLEVVRHPRHGYGKNMNPCVDCRIMQLKIARKYMDKIGADFLISGEVVGQRPMSQMRRTLALIDRRAEVEGLILRPLSAQLLDPAIPEKEGWVDRSKLYGISGRSRKEQKKLAEEFGISDYPEAGGGCRLTYEGFAKKMKDLIDHKDPDSGDAYLLQVGRHFRTSKRGKAIVGKDEKENELLKKLAREGDIIFEVHGGRGATVLLRDGDSELDAVLAGCLCVSHSKLPDGETFMPIRYWHHGSNRQSARQLAPLDKEQIEKMRI